jgi:hypothetical protein
MWLVLPGGSAPLSVFTLDSVLVVNFSFLGSKVVNDTGVVIEEIFCCYIVNNILFNMIAILRLFTVRA